jgi:cell division septation protein DedD
METDIERGGIDAGGGAHEPSYYEIALTNRQVVVAFVILLVCVVAAFLSGVWIGRESMARAQQKLAMLASSNPGAQGAEAGDKEKPEGQALQEFKFFADPRNRPAGEAKGARVGKGAREGKTTRRASEGAAASSTLAEDLGGRTGSPAPAASGSSASALAPIPPVASSSRTRPPAVAGQAAPQAPGAAAAGGSSATRKSTSGEAGATARAAHPAKPGSDASAREAGEEAGTAGGAAASGAPPAAGEGEPLPGAKSGTGRATGGGDAEAAGEPGPAGATASAGASGRAGAGGKAGAKTGSGKSSISWSPAGIASASELVIQVFSTADREQADKVRERLAGAGFTTYLSPIARPGGQTMYRVRIGPFASRAAAETVAEKVRKEQKLDTWITPR